MDSDSWGQMLKLSIEHSRIGDMHFPGWPEDAVQKVLTSKWGTAGIDEILIFYKNLHHSISKLSWAIAADTSLLDFGCGWGRVLRFFLKDIAPAQLYGADINPANIDLCRQLFPEETVPAANFLLTRQLPSMELPNHSLDLITAYSVFTHLSEDTALAWFEEFHRILKPGGLVCVTIMQKNFLHQCWEAASLEKPTMAQINFMKMIGNLDECLAAYEGGEFLYFAVGGGGILDKSFFGWSVIPEAFIREKLGKLFVVRECFDDRKRMEHAFLLMQAL